MDAQWVNGTVLRYWFFDGPEAQKQAVRDAFAHWKSLGLGLDVVEVTARSEAEVRIAFDQADGAWSYIGRDVLGIASTNPTMNCGWNLMDDHGRTTALHERHSKAMHLLETTSKQPPRTPSGQATTTKPPGGIYRHGFAKRSESTCYAKKSPPAKPLTTPNARNFT